MLREVAEDMQECEGILAYFEDSCISSGAFRGAMRRNELIIVFLGMLKGWPLNAPFPVACYDKASRNCAMSMRSLFSATPSLMETMRQASNKSSRYRSRITGLMCARSASASSASSLT